MTLALAAAILMFDVNAPARDDLRRATLDGVTYDRMRCVAVLRDVGDVPGICMQIEEGVGGPRDSIRTSLIWWPMETIRQAATDFTYLLDANCAILHEAN